MRGSHDQDPYHVHGSWRRNLYHGQEREKTTDVKQH